MTMPFTHKKDEVRATGTLEARTPGDQAVQVLLYVIIALVALACVLPFIYVVAGSFATERELTERPFFLIPAGCIAERLPVHPQGRAMCSAD